MSLLGVGGLVELQLGGCESPGPSPSPFTMLLPAVPLPPAAAASASRVSTVSGVTALLRAAAPTPPFISTKEWSSTTWELLMSDVLEHRSNMVFIFNTWLCTARLSIDNSSSFSAAWFTNGSPCDDTPVTTSNWTKCSTTTNKCVSDTSFHSLNKWQQTVTSVSFGAILQQRSS